MSKKKGKKIVNNPGMVQKKCMGIRCGKPCWRSDVNYCWECLKYQLFESK